MQTVVLATESQRAEWEKKGPENIVWVEKEDELFSFADAAAFIDLQYQNTAKRNALLAGLLPRLVIVNSVTDTLAEIHTDFVRINGWPGFSASVVEATCLDEKFRRTAEGVFAQLQREPEWLPDTPGFVTPRVISMIINEAYLALREGVSTKEEINTAMKLGTAYPYGPFEWGEKIGLKNILVLLQKLEEQQARYTPAPLLVQEAGR